MMKNYTWQNATRQQQAYAKINTYLEVLGRRPDGYHELCSHIQLLTLCDTLQVTTEARPGEALSVTLRCDQPQLSCGEDNLIVRAVRAFCAALALPKEQEGVHIVIELQKQIPMQGGLGGGSADAAATLMALNALCGEPMDTAALCAVGITLGADVPMCICGHKGAQTARGIGELLTPAPGLSKDVSLLVVLPGTAVSTPAAFRLLDERYTPAQIKEREQALPQHYDAHLQALAAGEVGALANTSFNRFEEAVFALQPQTKQVYELMQGLRADAVRMSGSGPTLVGYFTDVAAAESAQSFLQERGFVAHLCHPLV